jgi:hypothetical protein
MIAAVDVLPAAVERDMQAAPGIGALRRNVSIGDGAHARSSLAGVEELALVESDQRAVVVRVLRHGGEIVGI